MSVLKPRNRLVYFRVSEEELNMFHQLQVSQGVRSLSELARTAMKRMAEPQIGDEPAVQAKLERVDRLIGELDGKIERLESLLMGTLRTSEAGTGGNSLKENEA